MAKTENILVRVDNQLKDKANALFEEMGTDMSKAVRAFLMAVVREKGLPFPTAPQEKALK